MDFATAVGIVAAYLARPTNTFRCLMVGVTNESGVSLNDVATALGLFQDPNR